MKHFIRIAVFTVALAALTLAPKPAAAQSDPLLGQLMLVGFNFCPRAWLPAEGQLLSISSNQALFSLFGTMYGGDGRTTFGLPDLRGRVPISAGNAPGLNDYRQGQKGGSEMFSIGVANLPAHNHDIRATVQVADKGGPGNKYLGGTPSPRQIYSEGTPDKLLAADAITHEGQDQPISKRSPYTVMRWCVSTQGVFPSRN